MHGIFGFVFPLNLSMLYYPFHCHTFRKRILVAGSVPLQYSIVRKTYILAANKPGVDVLLVYQGVYHVCVAIQRVRLRFAFIYL